MICSDLLLDRMSSPATDNLLQAWEAAKATPFQPLVSKDSQFFVAFSLLLVGMLYVSIFKVSLTDQLPAFVLTGTFALSASARHCIQVVPIWLTSH